MDTLQHLHHFDVGPAVQRPPQRAYRRGARGEKVRPRRADDPGRRRAAILLVVGVEDEDQVQGVLDFVRDVVLLVGNREHHVQEVCTVAQVGIGIVERQSQRTPIGKGGNRPHFADQSGGQFLERLLVTQREELGVKAGHVAQRRREQSHRWGVGGNVLELVLHALVQQLVQRQPLAESIQFVLLGQPAENQQPGSLDKIGMVGELLDGNAAIAEDSLVPVDERDRTFADGRVRQRRVIGGQSGGVAEP